MGWIIHRGAERAQPVTISTSTNSRVAPDGRQIHLATDEDRSDPYIFVIVAIVHGHRAQFVVGNRDHGRLIASEAGVPLSERYSFQNGTLAFGELTTVDEVSKLRETLQLGIWEGNHASLKCFLYNQTSSDLIALLDNFDLTEVPEGLLIAPKTKETTLVPHGRGAVRFVQNLPGLGLLETSPIDTVPAGELPSWKGRSVPAGELFVQESAERQVYVLLSDSSFTRLYPNLHQIEEKEAVERLSRLHARWFPVGDLSTQSSFPI